MANPRAARRPDSFYGWWMVGLCTIARGFTAPGQTIGVSAFTDDLIETLDISRSAVSTTYLIGTLTGAVALPLVGRWVDAAGVRRTLLFVAVAFSGAILFASSVQNAIMLSLAFVGLRMLGQGSLSLIGTQGVVLWFERRRGFALALSGMGTLILMSMSPLVFTWLINQIGWRQAFVTLAIGVVVVLVPIALFGIVDRPEDIGQVPDGKAEDQTGPVIRGRSFTVAEALRTPAFWTLVGLTLMAGAISTGLTFHNVDLLGERGFSEGQAAAIFIPMMIGGATASFAFGWLTDRVSARPLMFVSGLALGVGAFLSTITSPGPMAVVYGLTMGIAGGSAGANSSALMPKWFGVDHIGSIRGIASTANVGASAIGPLLLSLGNDAADSYGPVVTACAIAAASMAAISLVIATPRNEPVSPSG